MAAEFNEVPPPPESGGAAETEAERLYREYLAAGGAPLNHPATSGVVEPSPTGWRAWVPLAMPALAILALISVFMPVMKVEFMGQKESFGYFNKDVGMLVGSQLRNTGILYIVLMLAAAGLGVAAIVVRKKWARLAAGIAAIVAGAIVLIEMIRITSSVGDLGGMVKTGAGVWFMLFLSLALAAAGVISLLPVKNAVGGLPPAPPAPAVPPAPPAP